MQADSDSDDDEDVKIEKAKAALRRWGKKKRHKNLKRRISWSLK